MATSSFVVPGSSSTDLYALVQNNNLEGLKLAFLAATSPSLKHRDHSSNSTNDSSSVDDDRQQQHAQSSVSVSPANTIFHDGLSLLHWAAVRQNGSEIVKYLINCGANVNYCGGPYAETALHWAARSDANIVTVKALMDAGANIHCKNVHGHDPLSYACQAGSIHIAFVL
jgi:ankyrin repeat protein